LQVYLDVLKERVGGVAIVSVVYEAVSVRLEHRVGVHSENPVKQVKRTSEILVPSIASIEILPDRKVVVSFRTPSTRLLPWIFGRNRALCDDDCELS